MKKRQSIFLIFCLIICFCFSGCSLDDLNMDINDKKTVAYDKVEYSNNKTISKESEVEKGMKKVHVNPNFKGQYAMVSRKMNLQNPNDAKRKVQEGYRITINGSNMTEKEINLWSDIASNKNFTMCTVDNAKDKLDELNYILEDEAKINNMTVKEFIESYGFSEKECKIFLESQSEKYVE